MSLSKGQISVILIFTCLFGGLYFGCSTKTEEQKDLEKSRAQNLELISIERIISENRDKISVRAKADLMLLEEKLNHLDSDTSKIEVYKSLASLWYAEGQALISGHYAEQIAIKQDDHQSWSIAGSTYAIAGQRSEDETEKKHAVIKSRACFEKALSIESENIDNKINLALSYVDLPDQGNPMKGILMLIDLNKKFPGNPSVLFQLGRLALGTNQLEKAVERLSEVVKIDKNRFEAYCLLAEAYEKLGDTEKAKEASKNCSINKN